MIELLKFASFILTAAFGVYGSIVQFWRPDGRVSRKGIIGVTGVLASAAAAAGLQIYEDREAEQDMLALLQANSKLLADMSRALSPLEKIEVEYLLEPDWTDESYAQIWTEMEGSYSDSGTSFGGTFYTSNQPGYKVIESTLCAISIDLIFFKSFTSSTEYRYDVTALAGELGEDLIVSLRNPCNSRFGAEEEPFSFEYDLRDGELHRLNFPVRVSVEATGSRFWRGNGNIISVADLLDTQLIIQLNSSGYRADFGYEETDRLRQIVGLKELVIRLPNGVILAFDSDNLAEFESDYNHRAYEFIFASEMATVLSDAYYNQFKHLD